MEMTAFCPDARTTDLVVQQVDGETLVYDLRSNEAHCLNETAAYLWKMCDGKTPVTSMITRARKDLGEIDEDLIRLGLAELQKVDLLAGEVAAGLDIPTSSRRAMLRKVALGLVAAPIVVSLVAPNVHASTSCACVNPGDCLTQTACPSTTNCNTSGVCAP